MGTLRGARAEWARRQCLDEPVADDPASIVRRTGWLHTAGGQGVYLALRARNPRLSRADVDRAVFEEETLVEVPAVRGSMMVVPREDVRLALHFAWRAAAVRSAKIREACDITDREMERLSTAVVDALGRASLTNDQIRDTVPSRFIRPLGEPGRRLGESSTLTLTLRELQLEGLVQRVAVDRHLDGGRFAYRRFSGASDAAADDDRCAELTSRLLRWAAPLSLEELTWWTGMSAREAKEALARNDAREVPIDGRPAPAWVSAGEDVGGVARSSGKARVVLLPFRDNFIGVRRRMGDLASVEAQDSVVLDWKTNRAAVGQLESLHHHAMLWDDRIVAVWEYDPECGEIVWLPIETPPSRVLTTIAAAVDEMQGFIRTQIRDARFYALDGGKARRQRIDGLRRLR